MISSYIWFSAKKKVSHLFSFGILNLLLAKSQKSITELSDELLGKLNSILSHEFWSKTALTSGQIKKDEDRDVLLEALMLMSEYDIQGYDKGC